ncbi:MAG: GGDEF domain-containing protein [Candidatus Carbobacillus sp.]|nr:GGDEF domain-containing protein [Candidatus Carbobacillus sp.]
MSDHVTEDIKLILEQTLTFLMRIGQFSAGWVSVREGETFSLLATVDLPSELTADNLSEMRWSPCLCQRLAHEGRINKSLDIIDCERLARYPDNPLKRHLTIPISVDHESVFALINLAYEGDRPLDTHTLKVYSEVADMLSALIRKILENEQTIHAYQDRFHMLSFLLTLSKQLFQTRTIEQLIDEVKKALQDFLQLNETVPVYINPKNGSDDHALVFDLPPSMTSDQVMIVSFVSELTDQAVRLIQLLEKQKNLAERDLLTGLPNQRALEQRASTLLDDRPKMIIMFNIRRLTYINEQYGRDIGDMVIVIVAERLRKLFPEKDQMFKVSGDEFLVICEDRVFNAISSLNRNMYLESIYEALHAPLELPDRKISLQVDMGIAIYPEHGSHLFDLWRKANLALLRGRMHHQRYQVFSPSIETSFLQDVSLKSSLRLAVEHGDFTFVFQPIYDILSGRMVRAEVLLRWEEGAPDVFIPLAEALGLMEAIDHFVLTKAHAVSKMLPIPLAVNLSPSTIAHKKAAEHILALADPQRITLEVTEHAITNSHAIKNLRRLKKAGFKIALDDFGKGYSHLALLPELPIQTLKLDRLFIVYRYRPKYRIILESLMAIAKHEAYRLEVVAEGIEDRDALECLMRLGVDHAQGYALSRPVPLETLQSMLHSTDHSFYNNERRPG